MIPGKTFDPATETSRRPTPEKFAHLRRWVEPVKRDIKITNITQMTDINTQLEQNAELYVDNIISRVIAQLIGKFGDGFVTIEATEEGELKVDTGAAARKTARAVINFSTAANHTIAAAVADKEIHITNITFTVGGETNLTFKSDTTAISGAMDFGGTDEPRGISDHLGCCPLKTTAGEAFVITSSAAVQVSGYVTGYYE
jgi:hypothetical protein